MKLSTYFGTALSLTTLMVLAGHAARAATDSADSSDSNRLPAATKTGETPAKPTAKPDAPAPSTAIATPAQSVKRYTLEDFVAAAQTGGSALAEQNGQVAFAEARLSLARAKAYPSGRLDVFVGPSPSATGNSIEGTTDRNRWGAASGVKAELSQPIYTFGALGSAREAATAGVAAERHLLDRDKWKLRTTIEEYYYGFQLAFELGGVAADLHTKLQDALDKGEKQREQGKRKAPSAGDLDKLRVYLDEVKVRESEAKKGLELARAAMAWQIGTYGQEVPRWDRANLEVHRTSIPTLQVAQQIASQNRPELKAMEQDLKAKAALVNVEHAQLLPTLFVAGTFNYSVDPVREDQFSPFAYDPLNDLGGTLVVGLRWNLGIFERNAQVSMARAEYIKSEGRKRHLGQGVLVEVEKNLRELEFQSLSADLREDGSRASKRVFTDALFAFNLGTGSAQTLLESIGGYALAEKSRFENIYDYNLAAARLEQSIGKSLDKDLGAQSDVGEKPAASVTN